MSKDIYHSLLPKLNTRNMGRYCIYTIVVLETIASSVIIPTLPSLHRSLHLSTTTIGGISSCSSLLVLVCSILQGKASDRYGKISILKLSAISQATGYFCLVLAVNTNFNPILSFLLYSLARFIPAIFKCGMTVSQAYIVDSSETSQQSVERIGTLMALSNAVFVVGPLLGGYLSTYDLLLPVKIGVIVCLVNFIVLCLQIDTKTFDQKTPKKSLSSFFNVDKENEVDNSKDHKNSSSVRIIDFKEAVSLKFLFQLGNTMYDAFYSQLLYDRLQLSTKSIGYLFSLSGVTSSFTNGYILPYLYKNYSQIDEILILASFGQVIGLWLWSRPHPSILLAILSTIIVSTSSNIFLTICQSCIAVSPSIEKHGTGTTLSLSSTVDRAARTVAPVVGGMMIQSFGSTSLGYIASSSALACGLILSSSLTHASAIRIPTKSYIWKTSSKWIKEYGTVVFNRQDRILQE